MASPSNQSSGEGDVRISSSIRTEEPAVSIRREEPAVSSRRVSSTIATTRSGNNLPPAVDGNHQAAAIPGNQLPLRIDGNQLAGAINENHLGAANAGNHQAAAIPGNQLPPPIDGNHLGAGNAGNHENHMPAMGNTIVQTGTIENFRGRAFETSRCIFKIPEFLTRNKKNSYDYQPTIVSIGPYHRGKQQLQNIEEHKRRFQEFFVSLAGRNRVSMDNLVDAVAARQQDIRDSYSEDLVGFPDNILVEMMVLDGCFLLTMFLRAAKKDSYEDPIFDLAWVLSSIQRDLLLLENQVPMFILQILLDTANIPDCLTTMALEFFSSSIEKPRISRAVHHDRDAKHLLDLIRRSFIPISPQTTIRVPSLESGTNSPMVPNDVPKLIFSVEKLRSCGIKFKLKTNTVNTFLDISLHNRKLQIPEIILDDLICLVLLNCIAFEQFCTDSTNHMTSYAMFMGCLINNKRDAAFLREEGIIQNYFGTDDEVSRFFKRIDKDYAFDIKSSYLAEVFLGVEKYTTNSVHLFKAGFKQTYFGSLWICVSSFAALTLLILTLLQVIYAAGFLTPRSQGKGNGKQG